jgi:hypothetical protein
MSSYINVSVDPDVIPNARAHTLPAGLAAPDWPHRQSVVLELGDVVVNVTLQQAEQLHGLIGDILGDEADL